MAKPFVKVTWLDAEDFRDATWATAEEAAAFNAKPCEVVSYGYLIAKSRTHLTIAADLAEPETYGRLIKIPRKMIQQTEDLTDRFASKPPVV